MKPSLGVYGPFGADRSGVAHYIEESIVHLRDRYRVEVVSNAKWRDPSSFDEVIYHLGNNGMHHSAFRAQLLRPGLTIIHEYLHLNYYYQMHQFIDEEIKKRILNRLAAASGIHAYSIPEFIGVCERANVDPYCIDIGIEEFAVVNATTNAVHSRNVAAMLQSRYPNAAVESIPFPVTPWNRFAIEQASASRRAIGLEPDDFVFGTFGFIGKYKRVPWILEAWKAWEDRPPNTRLIIVGQRQMDVDSNLDDVIEMGYVSNSAFIGLMASVDCGIQLRAPSLGEMSGPAASLSAHGCPLILSAVPEMKSLASGGRVMLVDSIGDPISSLVEAMRAQYKRGPLRRRVFDDRFSWRAWQDSVTLLLGGM